MILAPLRGVTVRCFRETFADLLAEAGFGEVLTPFVTATAGFDPTRDRELRDARPDALPFRVTPQFIGKDPAALRTCLARVRDAGFETADLNCGCPFPMVRNKGRGSGLLRTPDVLCRMVETGCAVMGPGCFSVKARLGVERTDELLSLMPDLNGFPLRYLTVHARTARQMYEGACDTAAFDRVVAAAAMPVVRNGDVPFPPPALAQGGMETMIGRGFIRHLGDRPDADQLLGRYLESSRRELSGDQPVLGRMKELISYWKDLPRWRRRWNLVKICRTVGELEMVVRT